MYVAIPGFVVIANELLYKEAYAVNKVCTGIVVLRCVERTRVLGCKMFSDAMLP